MQQIYEVVSLILELSRMPTKSVLIWLPSAVTVHRMRMYIAGIGRCIIHITNIPTEALKLNVVREIYVRNVCVCVCVCVYIHTNTNTHTHTHTHTHACLHMKNGEPQVLTRSLKQQ